MSSALISGTGPFSTGIRIAEMLALRERGMRVVGIDTRPAVALAPRNMTVLAFDLNVFDEPRGFDAWSSGLDHELRALGGELWPCECLVLCAAQYYAAPYIDHPRDIRRELVGTNIVGKTELIHIVLGRNVECGAVNRDTLTIVDFGSLHSVRGTSHRALYSASKAAGLALCAVLESGCEVTRAIHVAPGPIDTPMLHWNHWVLKEGGDPGLWLHILEEEARIYEAVFRYGDVSAMAKAVASYGETPERFLRTFERYLHRRQLLRETEEGILDPDVLAERVVEMLRVPDSADAGVYAFTGGRGELEEQFMPFDAFLG